MKVTKTFELVDKLNQVYGKDDTIVGKINGEWKYFSGKEYKEIVDNISYGLIELGYKKGDKIASVSNNRPEWNFLDMGMSQIGVVHVPIYPTISTEEYKHILSNSDAKALIVSDISTYKKIKEPTETISNIDEIFCYDKIEGLKNWKEVLDLGKEKAKKHKNLLKKIRNSISENDLLTIIYTSGTTGPSKGVMLSHKNILGNAICAMERVRLCETDKMLSFLPLCHIYERVSNYAYQYLGVSIYYAENFGTVNEDMKRFKVNGFVTVPRVLEMMYDKILAKGKDLGRIEKNLFYWGINVGLKFDFEKVEKNFLYKKKLQLADKIVFRKWREAFGNNVHTIISGGAPIQTKLARLFSAAGLSIQEGYGLTETSPIIGVNGHKPNENMIGTVGAPIRTVELKIANDGEILVKGPSVMLGYYKAEEKTKQIIDTDGWLHTGDVGELVNNKFLKITDRKKEIFKNSAGKYIAPQIIENKFKESELIDQIMVVGEGEKFASALISPNFNYLHYYAAKHKLHYRDNKELIQLTSVIKRVQREVNEMNKHIGQVEQIKRFRLVCESWGTSTGELSQTLKLKRRVLYQRYEPILRDIYQYKEGETNRANKE